MLTHVFRLRERPLPSSRMVVVRPEGARRGDGKRQRLWRKVVRRAPFHSVPYSETSSVPCMADSKRELQQVSNLEITGAALKRVEIALSTHQVFGHRVTCQSPKLLSLACYRCIHPLKNHAVMARADPFVLPRTMHSIPSHAPPSSVAPLPAIPSTISTPLRGDP